MNGRLFTIALPVRNGGAYLRLCVESILAQSCGDFELAVLDNASTDGSAEWVRGLSDERIRFYPAERPLSIEENWARIKEIPKHEFLTTIGHDDLLDPDFLEVISNLIQAHPDAGLYCTHFRLIDAHGATVRRCRPMPARESAAESLASRLCGLRDSYGTGHVLRSAAYDAVGGIPPYPKLLYADDALFLQAIGASYKATALEESFSYRAHPASTSGACIAGEMFEGLEHFTGLLREMQAGDAAMREVLRRYFADFAVGAGMLWLTEERILALRGHRVPDPEIAPRVLALAASFGGQPKLPPPSGLLAQALEKSAHSRPHRELYRMMTWQIRAKAWLRQRLFRPS